MLVRKQKNALEFVELHTFIGESNIIVYTTKMARMAKKYY